MGDCSVTAWRSYGVTCDRMQRRWECKLTVSMQAAKKVEVVKKVDAPVAAAKPAAPTVTATVTDKLKQRAER